MIKAVTFDCWDTLVVLLTVGMKAILFTGISQEYRDNTTADFVIDSYSDLLGILEKL